MYYQYQYLSAAQKIFARQHSRVSRHVSAVFEQHEGSSLSAAEGSALPNDRRRRHTMEWVPPKGDADGGGGWQGMGLSSLRYHTRVLSKRSDAGGGARGLRHSSVAEASEQAERTAAAEGDLAWPDDRRRRHTTSWVPPKVTPSKGDAGGAGDGWQEIGTTSPRRHTWRTTAAVNVHSLASVPVGVQLRMQQPRREHSTH